MTEAWVTSLKTAYDAGYYRTESAVEAQLHFPWQNKSCQDCPFWANNTCRVHDEYRSSDTHTCSYFDPWNRTHALAIIQERQWQGFRRWWEWFNDHNVNR